MAKAVCPICRQPVAPRNSNAVYPFCSERCRIIDLGKWLGEEYRVPAEPAPEASSSAPSQPSDEE